jgi:hypothetical protein
MDIHCGNPSAVDFLADWLESCNAQACTNRSNSWSFRLKGVVCVTCNNPWKPNGREKIKQSEAIPVTGRGGP